MPEQKWVGWILVVAGMASLIFDIHIDHGKIEVGRREPFWKRIKMIGPQLLILVSAVGLIVGMGWYVARRNDAKPPPVVATNPADVAQKMAAIDEGRDLLTKRFWSIVKEGVSLKNALGSSPADQIPDLVKRLQIIQQNVGEGYNALTEFRYKYRYYDDIPQIMSGEPDKEEFWNPANRYANALTLRRQLLSTKQPLMDDPGRAADEFFSWIERLSQWTGKTENRLIDLRRTLSR